MASSKCSYCGAVTSVAPGKKAPIHQEKGKRSTCPGTNQPTSK